jgi:hypothetical protein
MGSWDFRGQLFIDNDCPRTVVHEFPRLSTKFFEFFKLSAKNQNCPRNSKIVHDYGQSITKNRRKQFKYFC